ncbi:succinyl-diaminopimelate desuccinylase [Aliidongia dinghuensis]|uniref:Succinyl-diaminopimelate desuccinylase n=1 Tax=Aliidongia dinghuensis TaxID=1867774 RepID=A0A8J2YRR4_9PROT|nr:succinyl-diaminopimelate desuccinylase [Aliidongia dinghuensis]GGF08766.1 succinyl-diaminopimelate desuccinylase [Aliidongia dinghuensis]
MSQALDPVGLAADLIRRPSVTPADAGALDVLASALEGVGFTCTRLPFSEPGTPDILNLFAKIGTGGRHFCFAGHTDVVPAGDPQSWSVDPFGGVVRDGLLLGRGAADMKGAIACFAAAAAQFVAKRGADFGGTISLLITGDEEGPGINGTVKMLDWLEARGETLDACVVGEPTNARMLGDMVKIGRRGSLTGHLTVQGIGGHTAYPHLADNAAHRLVAMLTALIAQPLDQGTEHFQASTLQISTIDVGNPATNVIPATARASFNIRFNDGWSGAGLEEWLRRTLDGVGGHYELEVKVSGESFLTPPGAVAALIADAAEAEIGRRPEYSTTGGTSDARFIRRLCPVAEFGLVGLTMHKADEAVPVADIAVLTRIYLGVLERFFAG